MLGVNRAARHINRRGCEGRTRRSAEAQFLALEIAQMLIDRQPCHGWQVMTRLPPGAVALAIVNVRLCGCAVGPGLGFIVSKETAQTTVPTNNKSITEKMTNAWRSRLSMRPYIRTSAIGNSIMQKVVKKLVPAFGFSNGWAEFMPKKPPPLVPIIFIGTKAASGPITMVCCFSWPLSAVPIAAGSSVETW